MGTAISRLTVYFEEPFWVGVVERDDGKKFETAKVVFGAEPKDGEIYAFFLKNFSRLRFSPPVKSSDTAQQAPGYKRMMRAAKKHLAENGIGTKAQQALKLQHEQTAVLRKTENRKKSEQFEQHKLELNRQKKKEKHRGH